MEDKVPILRILAHRIRDGRASRSGQLVQAERIRDEILAVTKGFTNMGLPDPRLTSYGDMDPRLTNLYTSYKNVDPTPHRVKPLPIQVLHRAQAISSSSAKAQATIDMAWIAYFYLLRPGEHCKALENSPLMLADVTLLISSTHLALLTTTPADLNRVTDSSLTFDTQKNREHGEVIAQGRSGHTVACPTKSLIRRVQYLCSTGLTLTTPLCTFIVGTCWYHVTSHDITTLLRTAATSFPHIGFHLSDVNACSLCAGGAMALLCGRIDANTIQLVGRWKAMPCFAISTPRPYLWCGTSPTLCLPMALSRFSPAPTYRRAPLLSPP